MSNSKPLTLDQMICRALTAQIEMGLGEVVIDRNYQPQVITGGEARSEAILEDNLTHQVMAAQKDRLENEFNESAEQASMLLSEESQFKSLEEHYKAICHCTKCRLAENRNKFVYGVGNPNAALMFIGEGPGAEEDRLGEPFVGRAGKLLDRILAAMSLDRSQVYIANMVKCRPPGNRDPQPDEMDTCNPYLREQIRLIQPKIICALGRIAAQGLLKTTTPLGKLRGHWHDYQGIPVRVTYHPAALLRFASYKKDCWEDMQVIMARLDKVTG